MKRHVTAGYAFTPASARLDLSAIAGLTRGGLLAVLDISAGAVLYAIATPGYGASFNGLVLTLQAPMTGLAATDTLAVIFDDGAAAALEAGGNLAAIAANTPALGQKTSAGSVPVVLSSDGPFASTVGVQTDAAATSDGGAFSLVALVKRGLADWTTYLARVPSLGPAAKAASVPVTVASDQVVATLDGNGAAFSAAVVLTSGTTAAAGRSVGVLATAAGTVNLTLAGGGALTLPVAIGWQTFPFAATAFAFPSSGGAAGTVYNLL